MARLSIPEILDSLEGKSSSERVRILKSNDTKTLRQILYIAFSSKCEFALPDERPEGLNIKETPNGISRNNLYQQARKLKIFMKDTGYNHLSQSKRETLFFQILESVHSSEAELLLQLCVDRKLKTPLTYNEVAEAFQNLLPEIEQPVVEEVAVEETEEKKVYKDLQEVYEENIPKKEEKKVYKDLQEVYEENTPKKVKKSKNKKSSKKKRLSFAVITAILEPP